MKNIVVAASVLLLAYYGPQQDQSSHFDMVWMLGALAFLAVVAGRLAQSIRLPALLGWVAAGLALGKSGLQLVYPDVFSLHPILLLLAGLWIGLQVGLHLIWPAQLDWRGPVLLALATALVFVVVSVAVALLVELPQGLALLIGALACLWGPFTTVPEFGQRGALLLSVLGAGFALVVLSGVLILPESETVLKTGAVEWVLHVWSSLVAGGLLGLVLSLMRLFAAPLASLMVAFLFSALALAELGLMALPCGLVTGLVLGRDRSQARRVRLILHRSVPAAFMLFFGLMGTALDLGSLWSPVAGLYEIALVLVVVPLLLRVLAPMAYYPLTAPDPGPGRRIGWLLLPRGALLFELFYGPHGLEQYTLSEGLLGQAVLVDLLFSVLLFSALAALFGAKIFGREKARAAPARVQS